MASPSDIQRVPQGLLNVLGMQSAGATPPQLASSVSGVLDLLQFYGLTQRQILLTTNGALATNTAMDLALTPANSWGILFFAQATVGLDASMTSLTIRISLQRSSVGLFMGIASEQVQLPGIANDIGACGFVAPYPLLLPPSTTLRMSALFAGVASASCGLSAEIGLLG